MNNELKDYTLDDLQLTKEQFESWLTALKSGEYPQTTDALRDCYGYCSLGVLADIQLVQAGEYKWTHRFGFWELENPVLTSYNSIPSTVILHDLQSVLMDWNDENKLSFQQIANKLEAHFMPLFEAKAS